MLVLIDYVIRVTSKNYYSIGFGEILWNLLHLALAIISGFLIFYFSKKNNFSLLKPALIVSFCSLFHFILIWTYVIGTGIDSL